MTEFIYKNLVLEKLGAKDINLTVENGDIFAFIGHNGAFKLLTMLSIGEIFAIIIMIVYVLISVLLVFLLFAKGVEMFRNLQK